KTFFAYGKDFDILFSVFLFIIGFRAPKDFAKMVQPYLTQLEGLAELQEVDHIAIEMLEEFGFYYVTGLAKNNNASKRVIANNFLVFCFSGILILRCLIVHITGYLPLSS
uniref:Uncharacterized protein n=1 Tax=Salvator merianae TaxID=96440 RepID=A0A8D0E496_SALMN